MPDGTERILEILARSGTVRCGLFRQIDQDDIPVLENYDVISSFEPLTELPQALPAADDATQQNQDM